MSLEEKISCLIPKFHKIYDASKNLEGQGVFERFQKMLASEIDDNFFVFLQALTERTKSISNLPLTFLPYKENFRGTDKLGISSFVSVEVSDIYYGFPPSFLDAIAFRFNAKDTPNFTIREDAGDSFVVSYTDPISGITVNQPTASIQPKKHIGSVAFNNDCLINTTASVAGDSIVLVLKSIQLPFGYPNNPGDTYCIFSVNNNAAFYGDAGTGSIRTGFLLNQRQNNVPSNYTLNGGATVLYGEKLFSNPSNCITIGAYLEAPSGFPFRYTICEIYDAIVFNRALTPAELTELQNYLQDFHNFTP
ncbi:MAG: hypothetical protein OHK0045_21950 [Raineya sp.]